MNRRTLLAFVAATAGLLAASSTLPALAGDYPDRVVKFVVPFPPGGPTDALARRLAEGLQSRFPVGVVVDNKAGAGGNLGAEAVAKADPDGYTILFGTSGPLAINKSLYSKLPYDPLTSFAPVIYIGSLPNVLVVNADLPVKSVAELIAYAKANPGKVTFASSGNGASSHLAGVLFNRTAGTEILHVPYKGTGPALNDLLGGHVQMTFTDVLTALPHIQAGKLRALAVTSAERSNVLPDVPTVAEQGLQGFDVSVFFGVVAPKGTPQPVIGKLNEAFAAALKEPAIRSAFTAQGIMLSSDTSPAALTAKMETEGARWDKVILEAKVRLD
ncbi:Bug family tripartite tricarboxylate transporter substrate binding protein [Aquabacter sp. P-9]|uniref:Bug family tripartite tricarboxylate transporter substrate binding protein n=1 Tax=Aquabacter sediminis TaxID=3029197 RepID=UPI00237ECB59|nr:tripartite tricarboxylate transporter substrate binding protein [Aquabacter sp. P-9]MDE1568633.1 tripartite tricarboxylate transporter substrate binding protein [Aquabacter sp. P-9]